MTEPILDRLRKRLSEPHLPKTSNGQGQLYPSIHVEKVEAAEAELGFRLPDLLCGIYTEISNGGFGPGYGLFGLQGGAPASAVSFGAPIGLVERYLELRAELPRWPRGLLPICDWGEGLISCIDCVSPGYPMIFASSYSGEPITRGVSFDQWIEAWLNGEDLEM